MSLLKVEHSPTISSFYYVLGMRKWECKMGGKRKHTIDEIRYFLKEFNYILLDTEYTNQLQKLDMTCDKGHLCTISFKGFKNGNRCLICSNINRGLKQRRPYEEVRNILEKNNYQLLSNENDYINQNSLLYVICPNGHKNKISISGLKSAKFNCRKCTNERLSKEKRKDGDIVVQSFIDKGLTPLFIKNDYINVKQKLPYLCPNHLDEGKKFATHDDILHSKFVCKSCYLDNIQRENHWNWQGGISSLSEYLRIRLNDWKFESLKSYDFKCAITGVHTKDLEIHHLYNFSDIVKETLDNLNLPIMKIKDYTDEQLSMIEFTFHEIHNKYGLGIPLTKEIHTFYHMIYGFTNNSKIEFEDFKTKYLNNNEYKEVSQY